MIELLLTMLILLCLPFLVYVLVKVGTYAFYKGREHYEMEKRDDRKTKA